MVYVIAQNGKPLMPTERHGKVRRMVKNGRAKVVSRSPFTIQLLYGTGAERVQPVTLGIDSGYETTGFSAAAEKKVLYEEEHQMRTDIPSLLAARREKRGARRNRKTRYRKPRFDNRTREEGWLPPSAEARLRDHIQAARRISGFLPGSRIIAEIAAFDIQKINNPETEGAGYQEGERLGFWNTREYVLYRDGHKCRICGGKSKDMVLEVHHVIPRSAGGTDRPDNLITLCSHCHEGIHNGTVIPDFRKAPQFKAETMMSIMRWELYRRLKETFGKENVSLTYGCITKNTRIAHKLEKSHHIDARCISGNPGAVSDGIWYFTRKLRVNNRKIHKDTILKGGIRKRNQAPRYAGGFRLADSVLFNGTECYIHGRRTKGYFDIRKADGTRISPSVSCRKLRLVEHSKTYLIERRMSDSSPA